MHLYLTGLNFKTASVEIREKLSFTTEELAEAYKLLLAKKEIDECVILSTCNRVEIYAIMKEKRDTILTDFIRDFHKCSIDLDNVLYHKDGSEAIRHLCYVASGLDSMVVGESQIFGQVKDAYTYAQNNHAVGHGLDYLFEQVFSIVKKVRSKTHIGERNLSVSYAVVKMAKQLFNDLEKTKVLILGAGEMGELTVRNLMSAGVKNVFVANRTYQRAVDLAERFNGTPIMLHEIVEYIREIDIVISSITTNEYIIKKDRYCSAFENCNRNSILLFDISVPRSIDPEIAMIENTHLLNIDDLKAVVDSNSEARIKEAEKGKTIINSKLDTISEQLQSCDILPTIISIRSKAEEIRKEGIVETIGNLDFTTSEKAIIDTMTKKMINKIIYHSEQKFREYSNIIKNE